MIVQAFYISKYLFILEHKGDVNQQTCLQENKPSAVLYPSPTVLSSSMCLCLSLSQVSQVISGLSSLYWLNMNLCSKLQVGKCTHSHSDTHAHSLPCVHAVNTDSFSDLFVWTEPGSVGALHRHGAEHDPCLGR